MKHLASDGAFGRAFPDSLAIFINFDESGAGQTPPEVSRAVRRLLGLVVPGESLQAIDATRDDLYAIAQDYLKGFDRSDPSGRSSQLLIAYFSSFFHETRHVHDLLSTTFGQRILAANYNYYQNTYSVLDELKRWHKLTGKAVRIPLRQHVHAMPGLDEGIGKLVDRYVSHAKAQDEAGAPNGGIHARIYGSHLLEASATLIQLDMIHDVFGNEGANRFWRFLSEGNAAQTYTGLINAISEVFVMRDKMKTWQGGGGGAVLSYLLWAALQENRCRFAGEDAVASVVAYYHALAEHISRTGAGDIDVGWARTEVDAFNAQWGFPKIEESLASYEAEIKRMQQRVSANWQAADDFRRERLPAVYAAFANTFGMMKKAILSGPEDYFVGRRYAWSLLAGALPAVRIDFKVNGAHCVAFTAGPRCIPEPIFNEMIGYSTMLRMLVDGRDTTGLKDLEDGCYAAVTQDNGIALSDGLFD